MLDKIKTPFWKNTAERMVKTFFQGYFGFWALTLGLLGTGAEVAGADSFDTLFAMDNVKAGVVLVALSLASSVGAKGFGPHKEDPSLF